MTTTETEHGFYCPCDGCCGWDVITATPACEFGGPIDEGGCRKPATHDVVATRPDGTVVERRPMCHGHAVYAAHIYDEPDGTRLYVAARP